KSLLNALQLFSSNSFAKVLSVLALGFYARYLTKEELSLIPIYVMIGGMSILLTNFGILPIFVKLLPSLFKKDEEKARGLIRSGLILILPGVFLFSFFTFVFSRDISLLVFKKENYSMFISIMSIGFFCTGFRQVANYLFWAAARFDKQSLIITIEIITRVVLSITLISSYGVIGLVIGFVVGSIISAFLSLYFLKDVIFKSINKTYKINKLLKESIPFYLESYLMYFRSQGDQLIVTSFLGVELLAVYYIARRIYDALRTFLESLDRVLTENLSKERYNKKVFEEKIYKLFLLNAYVVIPLIFGIIGLTPFFINSLFGQSFQEAIFPSIILCFTLLAQFYWGITIGRSIFIFKSSTSRFKLTLVNSVLLMAFLLIFTNIFSIIGIALARLLATIFTGIYGFFAIRKIINIKINIYGTLVSFFSSILFSAVLLIGQAINDNYYYIPLYLVSGFLLFLILVHEKISSEYYSVLNSVLPIKVKDPIEEVFKVFRKQRT
ncbi:MAG: oligosaccharide flippase family protein, partial [Promethearchaeota archaeon]